MKLISQSCNSSYHRLHQFGPENVRTHFPLAMRRVPVLKQVSANLIPNFQSSCVYQIKILDSKGTRENESEESQRKGIIEEKEERLKLTPPPLPPEKPLPGDCCGSGCVRCVWDEYYEELEAYQKLKKQDSASDS